MDQRGQSEQPARQRKARSANWTPGCKVVLPPRKREGTKVLPSPPGSPKRADLFPPRETPDHPGLQEKSACATFAANRARGRVSLALAATPQGARLTTLREEGSLRVRFPGACAGTPQAVLINTAGGIAGGDHFAVDLALDTDARLTVTTAAAEKIYRSLGPDACVDVTATLADGAELIWLPQETILFDRARLARTVTIALARATTLLFAEAIVFGRTAMG